MPEELCFLTTPMHEVDAAYSDTCCTCSWSVCLCFCVGHTGEPCKNGRTDRDAISGSILGPKNHVLDKGAHIRLLANTIVQSVRGIDAAL